MFENETLKIQTLCGGGGAKLLLMPLAMIQPLSFIRKWRGISAFSLAEVALAMGVAAFSLISIFGLLTVGIKNNQTSLEQTTAAALASAIVGDLRSTPSVSSTSAEFQISIPSAPSAANTKQLCLSEDGSLAAGAESRYLAYVNFPARASAAESAIPVRILITWPAAADLNNNPPKNFAGSYEVITSLWRD